jgi:hypothetical protein
MLIPPLNSYFSELMQNNTSGFHHTGAVDNNSHGIPHNSFDLHPVINTPPFLYPVTGQYQSVIEKKTKFKD